MSDVIIIDDVDMAEWHKNFLNRETQNGDFSSDNSEEKDIIRSPASFAGAAVWSCNQPYSTILGFSQERRDILYKRALGSLGWEEAIWYFENLDRIRNFDVKAPYPKDLSEYDLARLLYYVAESKFYRTTDKLITGLLRSSAIRGYPPAVLEAAKITSPDHSERRNWPIHFARETERWRREAQLLGYGVRNDGIVFALDPEASAWKGDIKAMVLMKAKYSWGSIEYWFWTWCAGCANAHAFDLNYQVRQMPKAPSFIYQAGLCLHAFKCDLLDHRHKVTDSWIQQYRWRHDGAQSAVFTWILVAKYYGLPVDVYCLISQLVWDERVNWPVPLEIVVELEEENYYSALIRHCEKRALSLDRGGPGGGIA